MEPPAVESDQAKPGVLDFQPLPPGTEFKVLFVYPNVQRVRTPQLGIAVLSACLKRIGATTRLFDVTTIHRGGELAAFKQAIEDYQPDLLAYSVRSNEWPLALELITHGRSLGLGQIVGGPHPTHAPEETIPHADAMVVGEGEGAIMDVVRRLAADQPLAGVANTWVNTDDGVVKTPKRDLIADLDLVPLPDWRLFGPAHFRQSYISRIMGGVELVGAIEGSRGCPFTCSYCSNEALMNQYAGQGKWRREKSPERIVEELEAFRAEFGRLDFVYWVDEIWLTNTERLKRFRDLYKPRIGVPFSIMERPECITEEKVRVSADAGLRFIAIGLESGDEELRTGLLNRRTTAESLIQAFTLPKKYGIKVHAFTMVGLPGQDVKSMMKTWRFVRRIRPDTAQFTVFYPLKATRLYDRTIEMGMYQPSEMGENYYHGSVLKQKGISPGLVQRYQELFSTYATKSGVWPVVAFHFYRTVVPAYWLRFVIPPKVAGFMRYYWARSRQLYRSGGLKEVWGKALAVLRRSATVGSRRIARPGAPN